MGHDKTPMTPAVRALREAGVLAAGHLQRRVQDPDVENAGAAQRISLDDILVDGGRLEALSVEDNVATLQAEADRPALQ